jgi:high-affinity Fe2+/Pb2+ permease
MTTDIESIRANTLKQIEKTESSYKLAFVGAALLETAFLAGFLLLADLSNREHVLLFISTMAIYGILAFGLVALGIHNNRNTLRILRAIETSEK